MLFNECSASHLHFTKSALRWCFISRTVSLGNLKLQAGQDGSPDLKPYGHLK